jgi:polyhydroxyalkanoate synthesis repressor PhaR
VWQRSSVPPAVPSLTEEKQKTIRRNESGKIRILLWLAFHTSLIAASYVLLQCSINFNIRFMAICVNMYLRSVHRSKRCTRKPTMKPETVVIKKYENRRLYDSSNSKYVNLDDIAEFVRAGKEVQVVDAKTGQDLTRVTLTQIITEDAKDKPTGLPLELLRQLIVASDEVRQEFVMWYLKSAFDTYQRVQDAVQSRLGEVQSAVLSPVDMMKQLLRAAPASEPRAEPELEALRARVAELEARLKKTPPGEQRSGRKRKRTV